HYFEHVAPNADLYRRTLGERGSAVAQARLRQRVTQIILGELAFSEPAMAGPGGLPAPVAAAAMAGTLIGVLIAWLEQEPLPDPSVGARWAWGAVTHPPQH